MFASVLIANRGEIAVRIIRALKARSIKAIAVHSDADENAMHVRCADAAYRIGPAAAADSYLDIARIIEAARTSGAQAIHPGYGLLSESPAFAQAVSEAGIVYIGPPPAVIAQMADKEVARHTAAAIGIPILPGLAIDGDAPDATAIAATVGFPLLIKARFGGGGRGMRIVRDSKDLDEAIAAAQREAAAAFGQSALFAERLVDGARHVEVQILADNNGVILHVGDRDCTIQRRHQKLIEEAPAPGLPDDLRAALHDAAVTLCRHVGYRGAGTVEFLAEPARGRFHFMEMNTRLQVEHGVSELVSGLDLVDAQLLIAAGRSLPWAQRDIVLRGHAIQARLAAEEPRQHFLPASGRIGTLRVPHGPWLRADFGIEAGDTISPFYDSLFGKLLAVAPDRETAICRLAVALDEFRLSGFPSTAPIYAGCSTSATFTQFAITRDRSRIGRSISRPTTDSLNQPMARRCGRSAFPEHERSTYAFTAGRRRPRRASQ